MPPDLQQRARQAAVVFVTRRGGQEILWLRRADNLSFLAGFWALPGGGVEAHDLQGSSTGDHDAARRAALRELAEETGLEPTGDRLAFAGQSHTPPWAPVPYATTYFLLEVEADAQVTLQGGEHVAYEWVTATGARGAWTRGERLTTELLLRGMEAIADGPDAVARAVAQPERVPRLMTLFPGLEVIALRTPTLPPATHTNCYLVGDIVIDPASPYPEEQAALAEAVALRGVPVREIWLTHHHVDHVSGALALAEVTGATICAHARTRELLGDRVPVGRLLEDGERAGGLTCVLTEGHDRGHLAFVHQATGCVIAGDLVASVGTIIIDPDEGDMATYLESLARVAALRPTVLLPAHGAPITDPQGKLEAYRKHRLMREALVWEALVAHGRPALPRELVPAAYADTPAALHGLAARSLEAHLVKLVKDGRAAREGDRFAAI